MSEERIESLLAKMTLEEKASLLAGADLWHTVAVPRLGIPQIKVTDGPNGARGAEGDSAPGAVCFPCGVALGATWNTELVKEIGKALADEVKAKGAHILLAPTVNIHRTPLAGRNFECYSEDPYLTGRMATAYIQGIQSNDAGACIKHFVCNDQEYQRNSISVEISERPLREIYLRPFQMAIRDAQPWSVMSSYNRVNDIFASENETLLLDILKGEWGFDGLVMSDWGGTYSTRVPASGLDLEMPGPGKWQTDESVLESVRSGKVSQAFIDDKVRRILRTIERAGAFEDPELKPEQAIDRPEHRELVRRTAGEAIVLLKNDSGLLPIQKERVKKIAVIGWGALYPPIMGGGSASVTPHYTIVPLEAIRQKAGPAVHVEYALGCATYRDLPELDPRWLTAADGQAGGLTVEIFDSPDLSGEAKNKTTVKVTNVFWSDQILKGANPQSFSARLSGKVTVPETGKYSFSLSGNGLFRLWIDGKPVIENWKTDTRGQHHPWSSKVVTMDTALEAGRPYTLEAEFSFKGSIPWRMLRLGCLPPQPEKPVEEAVQLAAGSDLVILFAGLSKEWESEGYDRPDMNLSEKQNELIEKVTAANPNTIIVLNSGSPVSMPWLSKAPALLQAWFGGQEMGNGIADVLFGERNPSGKLPVTFPVRLEDNPAFINYPGEHGRVHYGEGLFVGYRYYDKKDVAPLFPFGHGLSYTTFAYHNLAIEQAEYKPGETMRVSFEIENTGARGGQDTAQLYVRDVQSSLVRPVQELKAFAKVMLAPGERKTVTLELDHDALAYYDDEFKSWRAEKGDFEILVGSSSRDIRISGRFTYTGDPSPHAAGGSHWHIGVPIGQLLADPQAKAVLEEHIPEILESPELEHGLELTLEQIREYAPEFLTPELLETVNKALKAID